MEEGLTLGKVSVGALPKDATVKELNVCPAVNIHKAVELGLPNNVDIKDIIRDYITTHLSPQATVKKARTA